MLSKFVMKCLDRADRVLLAVFGNIDDHDG